MEDCVNYIPRMNDPSSYMYFRGEDSSGYEYVWEGYLLATYHSADVCQNHYIEHFVSLLGSRPC